MLEPGMSNAPETTTRNWTFRVRRGPDDEVIVFLAGCDYVMSERQAETLGRMIVACCEGEYDDIGTVQP